MAWVAARYASRSLRRNVRRTVLSIVGIAVGCALALFMESVNRGRDEMFARAAVYNGSGHLRVVPAGWRDDRDVRRRLARPDEDLALVRSIPGVSAVAPRARADALLALGTRVAGVELTGVDPVAEPATNRFVHFVSDGRYLAAGDHGAIVIGAALATRLSAEVGDDLMATVVRPGGDIEGAMFRIVGIVRTGSEIVDLTVCQVPGHDLEALTSLPGPGELAVMLDDWRQTPAVRAQLAAGLGADDVLAWEEINPEFREHLRQDQTTARAVSFIIIFIVLLGVTSAQLAAVLERRREFAVLSALGMSVSAMVRLLLQEAVALGLAGATLGLVLAGPVVRHFARTGFDFSRFAGTNTTFGGALFEPVIYLQFGAWMVPYALAVAVGGSILASIYPARFAARIDPAAALRVAQ